MSIAALLNDKTKINTTVSVEGWVRTRRDSKAGMSFIALYDGSCFATLQIIAHSDLSNYDSEILKLTAGCSIQVVGKLVPSEGQGQPVEIKAERVTVIGFIDNPEHYPISPKRHTLEYLREVQHLRARTNIMGAVTRVRHSVAHAIHEFFHQQGFFWINTPIITTNDCEGAGELFRVSTLDLTHIPKDDQGKVNFKEDFFGREAFLTVSGQLNAEAYALALSKVYTFGPTFRAENSNTSRHLAEFWMIEPEMAFATLKEDAVLAEALLKQVLATVLRERADDMAFFNEWVDKTCIARLEQVIHNNFVRMTYNEAVAILEKENSRFEYPVRWGIDLQSEHERYLAEHYVKAPVILTDYPKDIKAFYMRLNDDGKTVAAMDVLAPGIGEIIGGSQREERLEVLTQRMQDSGLNPEEYSWYLDLRRYGSVPHAGFGLGFERLLSYITGVANVRDVIPFPRAPGQAKY
ncbi:MAG: asnS [Gammaproteobacteria bacterium]|jgi:asparaginyl-tRNA synthetase|nr:asnS [Gammaproteobacteria bacterium]